MASIRWLRLQYTIQSIESVIQLIPRERIPQSSKAVDCVHGSTDWTILDGIESALTTFITLPVDLKVVRGKHIMGAVISVRAWFGASKRVTPAPISVVPAVKAGETTSILPPLMQSIKTGNVANVEACLHAGKDVNQVGMWGNTPLICACQYGKERIALLLLDNGACVHSVNHKGANALLYACLEGLNTVVKRLVLSGNVSIETAHATIFNFTNDSYVEHSPLSAAAVNGHSQILSLLLKRFTWPPASLAAALTQAIMGKQRYCVELLLSSSSRTTYSDAVPYNYIGMEGLADVVDLLLRAGFDPSDMEPTLLAACEHDQQHVIQTLIKQGIKQTLLGGAAVLAQRSGPFRGK